MADEPEKDDKPVQALDAGDIALLKSYVRSPCVRAFTRLRFPGPPAPAPSWPRWGTSHSLWRSLVLVAIV